MELEPGAETEPQYETEVMGRGRRHWLKYSAGFLLIIIFALASIVFTDWYQRQSQAIADEVAKHLMK